MRAKLARAVIAPVFLASVFALMGGASASAATPRVAPGEQIVITYYNSTYTTVVGVYEFGCVYYSWGVSSAYSSTHAYGC